MKDKKVSLGQYCTSSEVADFVVRLTNKPKNSKVLDSGCGEGVFIGSLLIPTNIVVLTYFGCEV